MQTKISSGPNRLSTHHSQGTGNPGVIFCGGFKSSQQGQKALALEAFCRRENYPFIRFDYSGHGESEGAFTDGSIDTWFKDTLSVIDYFAAPEKLIIVGSSMGAWISVLAAMHRPNRIAALVTIAAAPDFTERLMKRRFNAEQLKKLEKDGYLKLPSDYDDGSPYHITQRLLTESRQHCVLTRSIDIDIPVRLLHGTGDKDVPFELSLELMNQIHSSDAELTLVKEGDHRLSEPAQLALLERTIKQLHSALQG